MNAAREPDARPGETPATIDELIDEAWRERAHDLSRLDALALQLLASAGTDPRARGHGLTLQALRMVQLGRADEADGLIAQAQGLFDSVGDLRGQCLVRDVVASRLILQGRCEEALATIGPNLERAAGERNAHDEFLSWSRAALAADHLGRFEDGLRFVYRQLASAQRSGDAALLAQSLGAIGGAHAEWLNLDDAEPLCRQAYQLARGQAWTQPGLTAYLSWGVILVLRGRHAEATAVAYEIIEALANQPTFQNWRNPFLVAWIFAHAGDHGAAQAWLDRGLALAPSPDVPPGEWVKTQAMVWVRQGRHADARRICQAASTRSQRMRGPHHGSVPARHDKALTVARSAHHALRGGRIEVRGGLSGLDVVRGTARVPYAPRNGERS